jgi:outer membrane protein assembly factor BamE (lipoprotein component of BamABCDE complex)
MKMYHVMLALMAVTGVAACTTTTGNGQMKLLTQHSADKLLVPGKTTRAEVAQQLGEGMLLRFDSGYEVWDYEFAHGIPRFVDYVPYIGHLSRHVRREGKEVRILFDPNGVVQKYLVLDIEVDPNKAQTSAN